MTGLLRHPCGLQRLSRRAGQVDRGTFCAHAPMEELAALCYAQHYAESGGKLDADANQSLMDEYGQERGRAILGYIRAIMVGNVWGNTFDSLLFRLKGKPTHSMTLASELAVLLGPIWMTPLIVLGRVLRR